MGKILAGVMALLGFLAAGAYLFYAPATVTMSVTDPPPEQYDSSISAITITFSKIEIHVANAADNSGWHNLAGGTVNLLDVLSVSKVLGSTSIPAGKYSEIRFFASQVTVKIDGLDVTYIIPGGDQTGFRVVIIGGGMQIFGGQSLTVQLDLAFRNSEIMNNPTMMLTPVATAKVVT